MDDSSIFPDVEIGDISRITEPVGHMLDKFAEANIPLLIKDITTPDIGVPTFVASSIEWISDDSGLFVKGYGTHPDSKIALIRAIAELFRKPEQPTSRVQEMT